MSNKKMDPEADLAAVCDFVETCRTHLDPMYYKTIYVGIDPGTSGGIGMISGTASVAVDIPVARKPVTRSKKTTAEEFAKTGHKTRGVKGSVAEFDYRQVIRLVGWISGYADVVVALEKIPTKLGPGPLRMGDVQLFGAWSMWPLYLATLGCVLLEPRPNEWKVAMGLKGGEENKDMARLQAVKLFPKCAAALARKDDHNRGEALLLAEYARRCRENGHNKPADDAGKRRKSK